MCICISLHEYLKSLHGSLGYVRQIHGMNMLFVFSLHAFKHLHQSNPPSATHRSA